MSPYLPKLIQEKFEEDRDAYVVSEKLIDDMGERWPGRKEAWEHGLA